MNTKEIEIKIKLLDPQALVKKVESLGGEKIAGEEGLEHDVYYDNSSGFYKSGRVLRLRTFFRGNLLSYKDPLEADDHLLKRTEIQFFVSNKETAEQLLAKLGFWPKLVKEKMSTHYALFGVVLEFHKLPFLGDFLEIEAGEEKLKSILPKLGLSLDAGINKGYNTLFTEYCKQHNLPSDVFLTFEDEKKYLSSHQ